MHFLIFSFPSTFSILQEKENELMKMNKPKFSLEKAQKAVEISSKIEGHKIQRRKSSQRKRAKSKPKN